MQKLEPGSEKKICNAPTMADKDRNSLGLNTLCPNNGQPEYAPKACAADC